MREGEQARGVNLSVQDKIRIMCELDEIGVDIIEAGWPAANPKDLDFFRKAKEYRLSNSKLAAFTSTRRKHIRASEDQMMLSTLSVEPDVVVVVGKSWSLHVREVLNVSLEDNIDIIVDTIQFFKDHGIEVIFDAEHFFDGYKEDRDYSMKVVKSVDELNVRTIVLCDTNGGCLPHEVYTIVSDVVKHVRTPIGVHMHNDSGNAVANTIMAVLAGASHVQVTVNGIGERCGNADLCQVVPNLVLKLGLKALRGGAESLRRLTYLSRLVYEITNIPRNPYQPYVGDYAFTHKAGIHVDAILKCRRAYEHVDPHVVGNVRQIVISELSGRSSIVYKLSETLGLKLSKDDERIKRALESIKRLEAEGYCFENALASAVLVALKHLGLYRKLFDVISWHVISEGDARSSRAWSLVKVRARDQELVEASEGVGPVHAVELSLTKALSKVYPEVNNIKLIDYKVSLLGVPKHTASMVRVEITFTDGRDVWTTTSTSSNIIEASLRAIVDGVDYYLQMRGLAQSASRT